MSRIETYMGYCKSLDGEGGLFSILSVCEQPLRLGAKYFFRIIKSTLLETLTWSGMFLTGVRTGVLL